MFETITLVSTTTLSCGATNDRSPYIHTVVTLSWRAILTADLTSTTSTMSSILLRGQIRSVLGLLLEIGDQSSTG